MYNFVLVIRTSLFMSFSLKEVKPTHATPEKLYKILHVSIWPGYI